MDLEQLRQDLMDHYGTAMHNGFPMAVIDLARVESASDDEILRIAEREGFNMSDYEV